MLLVDTEKKALIQDVELKSQIATSRPHSEWLQQQVSPSTCLQMINFVLELQLLVCPYVTVHVHPSGSQTNQASHDLSRESIYLRLTVIGITATSEYHTRFDRAHITLNWTWPLKIINRFSVFSLRFILHIYRTHTNNFWTKNICKQFFWYNLTHIRW